MVLFCFIVLHGKVMRKVGVEVVGLGALKLTGFLRELMQRQNINIESLYTIRSLKEVFVLSIFVCIVTALPFTSLGNNGCGMRYDSDILGI